MTDHPVHFVGSIPLADSEAVFRALAASVGETAKRWPDGETGERATGSVGRSRHSMTIRISSLNPLAQRCTVTRMLWNARSM